VKILKYLLTQKLEKQKKFDHSNIYDVMLVRKSGIY
jgi:hypothetical protein